MRPTILRPNGARGSQVRASLANPRGLPIDHSRSGRKPGEREKPATTTPNPPSPSQGNQTSQTRGRAKTPGKKAKREREGGVNFPVAHQHATIPKASPESSGKQTPLQVH